MSLSKREVKRKARESFCDFEKGQVEAYSNRRDNRDSLSCREYRYRMHNDWRRVACDTTDELGNYFRSRATNIQPATELIPVPQTTYFCGPTALSAVSGRRVSDVEGIIRYLGNYSFVKGTKVPEAVGAGLLLNLCFDRDNVEVFTTTIHNWMFSCLKKCKWGIYLVWVRGHFVAVDTKTLTIVDTGYRHPVSILDMDSKYFGKKSKVIAAWKISTCEYN